LFFLHVDTVGNAALYAASCRWTCGTGGGTGRQRQRCGRRARQAVAGYISPATLRKTYLLFSGLAFVPQRRIITCAISPALRLYAFSTSCFLSRVVTAGASLPLAMGIGDCAAGFFYVPCLQGVQALCYWNGGWRLRPLRRHGLCRLVASAGGVPALPSAPPPTTYLHLGAAGTLRARRAGRAEAAGRGAGAGAAAAFNTVPFAAAVLLLLYSRHLEHSAGLSARLSKAATGGIGAGVRQEGGLLARCAARPAATCAFPSAGAAALLLPHRDGWSGAWYYCGGGDGAGDFSLSPRHTTRYRLPLYYDHFRRRRNGIAVCGGDALFYLHVADARRGSLLHLFLSLHRVDAALHTARLACRLFFRRLGDACTPRHTPVRQGGTACHSLLSHMLQSFCCYPLQERSFSPPRACGSILLT